MSKPKKMQEALSIAEVKERNRSAMRGPYMRITDQRWPLPEFMSFHYADLMVLI
jgi:hypothetical protein